jgi:hypothetical protein
MADEQEQHHISKIYLGHKSSSPPQVNRKVSSLSRTIDMTHVHIEAPCRLAPHASLCT